jgi:hypothetical protein
MAGMNNSGSGYLVLNTGMTMQWKVFLKALPERKRDRDRLKRLG